MIVEGGKSRLAVECDGDEWHGVDRYEEDMARQRILERCGMNFWRITGYDYYRNRIKSLDPLWQKLEFMGIYPANKQKSGAVPQICDKPTLDNKILNTEKNDSIESHLGSFSPNKEAGATPPKKLTDYIIETTDIETDTKLPKEPAFYFELARLSKEQQALAPWERSLLFNIGRYYQQGWTPTDKMLKQAVRVLKSAGELGLLGS
jgi:hypothetical protein